MYYNATPYHRRVQERLAKARNLRATSKLDKYEKVDHFMLTYEQAYRTYYGISITISYKHGWYYIGTNKYRHSAVENMTNLLLAKIQGEYITQPEDTEDGPEG